MPIVVSKSHRWRVTMGHGFLIVFLLLTLFPLALVISHTEVNHPKPLYSY